MVKWLSVIVLLCLASTLAAQEPAKLNPAQSLLGMNLNGIADWNSELPFVDVFKISRPWISQKKGEGWGKGPALEIDEHGWVKKLDADCFAETPMCTGMEGHYPKGKWVVLYDGEGKLDLSGGGHKVVSSDPGRLVFEPDVARGGFFLRLAQTNPANSLEAAPASLEVVQASDGTSCLVLTGQPGVSYMIEARQTDGQETFWEPFWVGTLKEEQVALPIKPASGSRVYRVQAR